MQGVSELRFRRRAGVLAVVALTACATMLSAAPTANAEQASSKAKRLPAGVIDAGLFHTCAVLASGKVRCWGLGANGRLGYGNTNSIGDNETPASVGPVALGRRAAAVAAGGNHTCALLVNGRVRCWGLGGDGALGYGNTDWIGDDETPASVGPVALGRRAVAVTAGGDHTCALLDNGRVRCWGYGGDGALGYGNTARIGDDEIPSSVGTVHLGRRARAIAAGRQHTCALLDNGRVQCWGRAVSGELGYGNTNSIGDDETPASVGPVALGRRAVAIAAGLEHTCALLDNGRVRCWGSGTAGALGYGNTDDIGDDETPATVGVVSLGRRAVAISAGAAHTCAVLDNRRVRCWGYGSDGALGYGNTDWIGNDETPGSVGPVSIGANRRAFAITTGGFFGSHTCALLDNGRVRCWGYATDGVLGYGNTNKIGDNELPGSVGPLALGGNVARKQTPSVGLTLRPKRDTSAPYQVRTSGRLSGFNADWATCSGTVRVRATSGGGSVAKRVKAKFRSGRCVYAASLSLASSGGWKVTARFAGNGSLRARTSRARSFRAG